MPLVKRNLIYTAISRARTDARLVGDRTTLDRGIQTQPRIRKSMLVIKTRQAQHGWPAAWILKRGRSQNQKCASCACLESSVEKYCEFQRCAAWLRAGSAHNLSIYTVWSVEFSFSTSRIIVSVTARRKNAASLSPICRACAEISLWYSGVTRKRISMYFA